MKKILLIFAALVAVLAVSTAWADDLNPPGWRGDDRTLHVEWSFGENNPNPMPDVLETTLTDPIATCAVAGEQPFTNYESEYLGRQGVYKYEDYIRIELSNFPDEFDYKLIWLQITYTEDEPYIITDPAATSRELEQLLDLGDGWFHATYSIIIEPNPPSEVIFISPIPCAQFVDQIVIDTICIPEPVTVCLLGLGALALLRKRRP